MGLLPFDDMMLVMVLLLGNTRPMRRLAGDCRLRSRRTGRVRLTGVMAWPGVGGTEAGLTPDADALVKGVEGARMLRPPHLTHLGLSPAEPGVSDERLFRLPLRLGW